MDRFANRWPWLLAIAAVMMVAGCGGDRPRVVDPMLATDVATFEAECECRIPWSVIFGSVPAGVTALFDEGGSAIVFSRAAIDGYAARIGKQEFGLEPIIFHEFGHYVLLQVEHRNEMIDGRAASLMNADPTNFIYVYPEHREEYLSELFAH